METDIKNENKCGCNAGCGCGHKKWKKCGRGGSGGLYCIGFIGAAIYYIQHAATFWAGVIGVLKAAVWPAFLVHQVLTYFGM
jgi:hypothetical protein